MKNSSTETLRRDLKNLIDDAQTLFDDTTELSSESAQELRQKGEQLMRRSIDRLQQLEQSVVARGRQMATQTNEFVHEKPWTAIGLSAGVGLLIGMLISRR